MIDLTASPSVIWACTGETSEIRAVVTDMETSQPLVDEPVIFHTNIGQFGNEDTEQTVNTDDDGVATVTFSQGTASEGQTASITASLTGLPPSAWVRVPIVSPAPYNVEAVATGKTSTDDLKITLYWDEVPTATGYNVYRGTISGGEDYENPLNGTTPVTTRTYDGSDMFLFTDSTGLSSEIEYFYTVTAITSCGESQPSDEASATPDPNGVPWDTKDPELILNAFRDAFPDVFIPNQLRVMGFDGLAYETGNPNPILPDWAYNEDTNEIEFDSGEIVPVPVDLDMASGEQQTASLSSSVGVAAVPPNNMPNAGATGPYRKVQTKKDGSGKDVPYQGVEGRVLLPMADAEQYYHHPQTLQYWTKTKKSNVQRQVSTGDIFDIYLGTQSVDAGLQWSDHFADWQPFISSHYNGKNNYITKTKYLRGNGRYSDGEYVDMTFHISPVTKGLVELTLSGHSSGYLEAVGTTANVKKSGEMVKRVQSIAQTIPVSLSSYRKQGYVKTGSWMWICQWTNGKIIPQGKKPSDAEPWKSQTRLQDQGSWPHDTSVVSWYATDPWVTENNIYINLR